MIVIKKTIILFAIIAITAGIETNAQKLIIGAYTGANTDFVSLKTKYQIPDNCKYFPELSYNIGCYLKSINKQNYGLLFSGEYQRTAAKDNVDFIATGVVGAAVVNIGDYKKSIINHEFLINTIGTYKLTKKIYCGVGLSSAVLMRSNVRLNEELKVNGKSFGKVFKNYQYKPFSFSVPIIIGLSFNRIDLFLRFNKGLTNKIRSKESFFKERDNVILLGFGFKFTKDNKD